MERFGGKGESPFSRDGDSPMVIIVKRPSVNTCFFLMLGIFGYLLEILKGPKQILLMIVLENAA